MAELINENLWRYGDGFCVISQLSLEAALTKQSLPAYMAGLTADAIIAAAGDAGVTVLVPPSQQAV